MKIDKSVQANYRTGEKTRAKHRTGQSIGNMIVNHTPDFYDKADSGQFDKHIIKTAVGNGYMAGRTFKRSGKTFVDWTRKVRINRWRSKEYNKANSMGNSSKKIDKLSGRIDDTKHLNLRRSSKMTISNQTRKGINNVIHQEDMASKTVGKTMKGAWATVKYRKKLWKGARSIAVGIKSLITGVIAFVTSIPAMISGLIASLPVLIIMIIVSIVISMFSSYSYYGRIDALMKYLPSLESKYNCEINVVDVLSVSYALQWTKGSSDMYDTLVAYMYCSTWTRPETAENSDFETIIERVFNNRNPAHVLNNNDEYGVKTNIEKDSYNYTSVKKYNISYYLNIYPEYKSLKVGADKESYGSSANIEMLKQTARNSRTYNATAYADYIAEYTGFTYGDLNTGAKSERVNYLFSNGVVPNSEADARSYCVNVQVEILDKNGNTRVQNIYIHKALASTIVKIYQEMKAKGFRAYDNGTFSWRKIAGSNAMSNHSFGLAVDVNVYYNPQTEGNSILVGNVYDPVSYPQYTITSDIASIWKKYGFGWGGDYNSRNGKSYKDWMHFEYIKGSLVPGQKY